MANNVLINVQGLLEGKRVRKLPLKARLYYPLLLGLSNTFARLELDYDLLTARLASFRDPEADAGNIANWFKEYEKAKLVLVYTGNDAGADEPTMWAQFDTPSEYRRSYASKEDAASPAPPEALYTEWLKSIHGADWEKFDLSKYQQERQSDISLKRAEAGRKGAAMTNAKRWGASGEGQLNQQTDFAEAANRQSRLEVVEGEGRDEGVDEGVDEGRGEGEDTTSLHLKSKTGNLPSSTIPSSNQSITETEKAEIPVTGSGNRSISVPKNEGAPPPRICPYCSARIAGKSPEYLANHILREHPNATDADIIDLDGVAEELARIWGLLMQHNEKFDPSKLPAKTEKLWVADLRKLLDAYKPETIRDLMAYSQSISQREYNWNCKAFCSGCERNLKFMSATKQTSLWKPIWDRFVAIATGKYEPEEMEFLDETKTDTFDPAADNDDELA